MLKKIKIQMVMVYDDEITPDPSGWDWFDLLDLNSELMHVAFNELEITKEDQIDFENANADL